MTASSAIRDEIVAIGRRLLLDGIERGTSGNVSARTGATMIVTPSGVGYDTLSPNDLAEVFDDGRYRGALEPTREWRLHRAIYRARSDIGAIVHTHSPFATTVACMRRPIPAVHYYVALAGGAEIRCAEYATFGTQELADHTVRALEGRTACLLANHGLVALGATPTAAMHLATAIETVAMLYVRTLTTGEPVLLSEDEIAAAARRFERYGTQAGGDPELRPIA